VRSSKVRSSFTNFVASPAAGAYGGRGGSSRSCPRAELGHPRCSSDIGFRLSTGVAPGAGSCRWWVMGWGHVDPRVPCPGGAAGRAGCAGPGRRGRFVRGVSVGRQRHRRGDRFPRGVGGAGPSVAVGVGGRGRHPGPGRTRRLHRHRRLGRRPDRHHPRGRRRRAAESPGCSTRSTPPPGPRSRPAGCASSRSG
jgi:hypothetical protein